MEDVKIGDVVTYYDEFAQPHAALVTSTFGTTSAPGVNLVYVSPKTDETDTYGRQLKRETSAVHQSNQQAPGRYWVK